MPEYQTVWSGTLERQQSSLGLSRYMGASQLVICLTREPALSWGDQAAVRKDPPSPAQQVSRAKTRGAAWANAVRRYYGQHGETRTLRYYRIGLETLRRIRAGCQS